MCYVTHSLRFTSDATPAGLLVASMAAEPSLPHTCKALVGLENGSYHAAAHSVRSGRPDTLPTELSQLGNPLKIYFVSVHSQKYTNKFHIIVKHEHAHCHHFQKF